MISAPRAVHNPHLFDDAVAAAPSKVWLHTDGRTFTFEEAHALIQRAASAVAVRGVRPGPPRPRHGAQHARIPVRVARDGVRRRNHRRGEPPCRRERAGRPGSPGAAPAGRDRRRCPRFGGAGAGGDTIDVSALYSEPAGPTPPRPDRTTSPCSSRRAVRRVAPSSSCRPTGLRDGRRGVPVLDGAHGGGPADTSLPLFHINAPAYRRRLACRGARASSCCRGSPQRDSSPLLAGTARPSSTRSARCSRSSCANPSGSDDASTPLRLCYLGAVADTTAPGGDGAPLRLAHRLRLRACPRRRTAQIWAHGTRPFGTIGSLRQHPDAGTVNDGKVVDGELWLRNPAVMQGYWQLPDETTAVLRRRRLATHRRPRDGERRMAPTRSSPARKMCSVAAVRTSRPQR